MNADTKEAKISYPVQVLKYTYALIFVLAGVDRFFNIITDWTTLTSPILAHISHLSIQHVSYLIGILEIGIGCLLMTQWTTLASYVATLWIFSFTTNYVITHNYAIIVRDVLVGTGAYVLGQLSSSEYE